MAVTISTGKPVYSLTSRPEQPTPYPPSSFIAEVMKYEDRTILVTVPFPDTIELTADVLNEHLISPYATGGANQIAKLIDADLKELLDGIKKGETLATPKPKVRLGERAWVIFEIAYDTNEPLHRAHLTLVRRPGADFGSWSVRFEFSASKAGPPGLVKLTSAFEEALPFSFSAMLPDFRVSRIDPAIDLIGAYPLDVIAQVKTPGKRLVYVGQNGHPESVYLYEQKNPITKPPASLSFNTRGPLRLKMYERRDYCRQLMLKPPYGNCPVTRIEVEQRWKKKLQRPKLADLAGIKNLLIGRKVGYAAKIAGNLNQPKDWLAFCLAAFGGGVGSAQRAWPLSAGLKYRALYTGLPGDLVSSEKWEKWNAGLEHTGLAKWVHEAASSPPA